MSEIGSHKQYPIVPPNELRCVWMTAGVLSYQLCERKFECEDCPLDIALRQRFVNRELALGSAAAESFGEGTEKSHGAMLYGRNHVWLRQEGDDVVRIGLEPGLASVLVSPKAIVLPDLGEKIVRGKVCAWIVLDGGTLPIVSPVGGKVIATNAQLAENPHAVCLSPLGQGWLFELSVETGAVKTSEVYAAGEVARIYSDDERRFQALLSAELLRSGSTIGPTLADGGQALTSISEMLGAGKYFKLVREVYT